jgi:hypothetical protein
LTAAPDAPEQAVIIVRAAGTRLVALTSEAPLRERPIEAPL